MPIFKAKLERAVASVIEEGKYVTYHMKPDRTDSTAVGTREMAEANCKRMAELGCVDFRVKERKWTGHSHIGKHGPEGNRLTVSLTPAFMLLPSLKWTFRKPRSLGVRRLPMLV